MAQQNRENPIPQTEQEIEQFLIRNENMIHSVCHEFGSCGIEYEDLKQEATIGFLKGIRTYSPNKGTMLTTYCYKCAKNEILMIIRKRSSKGRKAVVLSLDEAFTPDGKDKPVDPANNLSSSEGDELHMTEASLEDQVVFRDLVRLITKYAHECLSDTEFKALMMWYQHASQEKIATALNISQGTASKLVHFSHAKLKWYLNQHGYFSYKDLMRE